MTKHTDLDPADQDQIRQVMAVVFEIAVSVVAPGDDNPHPGRRTATVLDEVEGPDGSVFLHLRTSMGVTFFMPTTFIHKDSMVRGIGDGGVLWVKKVWAIYCGWK